MVRQTAKSRRVAGGTPLAIQMPTMRVGDIQTANCEGTERKTWKLIIDNFRVQRNQSTQLMNMINTADSFQAIMKKNSLLTTLGYRKVVMTQSISVSNSTGSFEEMGRIERKRKR